MKRAKSTPCTLPATRFFALIIVSIAIQLVPGISAAQEAPPALEFSFSNPGARSMGLGGAFVALADDATAAFANPAGLVQLLRPEVSLELRRRDYSTPYTLGGRVVGLPTGLGIDTVDGIRTAFSNETTSGVSFLSFVYPGTRWSVALYRHQLADFSLATEINGLFGDVSEDVTRRYEDQWTVTDLDIVGTGLAGAYRVSDRLNLGFGVSYFSGKVDNQGATYAIDSSSQAFWGQNSFLPESHVGVQQFPGRRHGSGIQHRRTVEVRRQLAPRRRVSPRPTVSTTSSTIEPGRSTTNPRGPFSSP